MNGPNIRPIAIGRDDIKAKVKLFIFMRESKYHNGGYIIAAEIKNSKKVILPRPSS
jgi:hypothetical protein